MANTTHNTPERMTELAEHWEDEYWEEVIRDSNLEAEVVKAKERVIDCAVRWHELETDWSIAREALRVASLDDACRDLQALRVKGTTG